MRRVFAWCVVMSLAQSAVAELRSGLEVLRDENFARIAGKRVGLVSNPASVDANLRSAIDIFTSADQIKLVALFGPEHGIYGDQYAGARIADRRDEHTGLPVYSLYGKTREPTAEMVENLDVLVFDLQDIGSRSYTYISTMRLCMKRCAEEDIELVILDRPNPLGGHRIEGPVLDEKFESFVGMLPVPYVHGMTMGELALLVRERYFPDYDKLTVVQMTGYKRDMLWRDSGREWIPTSPHIPKAEHCAFYAATGVIGELLVMSIGVGYTLPFELVGAPWINPDALTYAMSQQGFKDVRFRPKRFKPFYNRFQGVPCQGVQVHLDPATKDNLFEINFRMLRALGAPNLLAQAPKRHEMFDKVCGGDEPRKVLMENGDLGALFAKWRQESEEFREARKPFLLYE